MTLNNGLSHMANPDLVRVDAAISQLSFSEQLWLMERLAQRMRERSQRLPGVVDQEIEDLARDPAIQCELQDIEAEFTMIAIHN
jgi:hypothetical protein